MPFSEFLGNPRIVTALRGMLASERVPHALLFAGPRGIGKFTLARMFAQAANCERLRDDFCGECETCRRIAGLAEPARLIEQGLAERGESADAATVERVPLILETHPDVWAVVPDPVRLRNSRGASCTTCGPAARRPAGRQFQTHSQTKGVYRGRLRNHALGPRQHLSEKHWRSRPRRPPLILLAANPLSICWRPSARAACNYFLLLWKRSRSKRYCSATRRWRRATASLRRNLRKAVRARRWRWNWNKPGSCGGRRWAFSLRPLRTVSASNLVRVDITAYQGAESAV